MYLERSRRIYGQLWVVRFLKTPILFFFFIFSVFFEFSITNIIKIINFYIQKNKYNSPLPNSLSCYFHSKYIIYRRENGEIMQNFSGTWPIYSLECFNFIHIPMNTTTNLLMKNSKIQLEHVSSEFFFYSFLSSLFRVEDYMGLSYN